MKEEMYKAAIETHKFYDSISITLVGGLITVSGAIIYLLEKISTPYQKIGILVVGILVVSFLLLIYRKCAYYANVARNVSASIEDNSCNVGVSIVLKELDKAEYEKYRAKKSMFKGIYGLVHGIWITLVGGMLTYIFSIIPIESIIGRICSFLNSWL